MFEKYKKKRLINKIKEALEMAEKVQMDILLRNLHAQYGNQALEDTIRMLHIAEGDGKIRLYAISIIILSAEPLSPIRDEYNDLLYSLGERSERDYKGFIHNRQLEFGNITEEQHAYRLLEDDLNDCRTKMEGYEEDTSAYEQTEVDFNQLRVQMLGYEYKWGKITAQEREKEQHTIDGKHWISFKIRPDPDMDDPDNLEIDTDYNELFIDWLRTHYDYSKAGQYVDESEDDVTEEDLIIESWVKSSIVKLAASFLAEKEGDQYGETFRSVVAGESEGSVVRNVEIDSDSLDKDDPHFDDIMKIIKNRKIYK